MYLTQNARLPGQTPLRAQTHHVACRVGHLRRRPPATPLAVAFQTDAYRTDDASPACITPLRRLRNDPFAIVSPDRGFLPARDPLQRLSDAAFEPYEAALAELPVLAMAGGRRGGLRRRLEALPPFATERLLPRRSGGGAVVSSEIDEDAVDGTQLYRAQLLLSTLSHAYVWCDGPDAAPELPARLAVPWVAVSRALDLPPVGTYASYVLLNWRRLDLEAPVELGNIACLSNYYAGADEEWFKLVHVAIEAAAAPGLAVLPALQAAAAARDDAGVQAGLDALGACVARMTATMARLTEQCDPHIYFHRVRRPTGGWRGSDELPEGLRYERVWAAPQQLYGGSGAQSSVLPALDAVLGVRHEQGWLREYLAAQRAHMPAPHRAYLATLEAGPDLRAALADGAPRSLRASYDAAVAELERFRGAHRGFASAYIASVAAAKKRGGAGGAAGAGAQHGQKAGGGGDGGGDPDGVRGTGGTRYGPALDGYRRATGAMRFFPGGSGGGGDGGGVEAPESQQQQQPQP